LKLSILNDTITETKALLKAKTENFNITFLQKKIYPEDIYNACDRRNLNSTDLERITDNLEVELQNYGIVVVQDTAKVRNKAKYSNEYEALKRYRYNDLAALHDATALYYVREKRTKKIRDFENVNCWFLNNSISREKYEIDKGSNLEYQPESIKADDFLNIIWLSNPQVDKSLNADEISEIGLSSLVSLSLTSSLPKLSIIRELDDNIHRYAQDGQLSDVDVVRVATRITTKQLSDIENLNKLAKENKELFVKRLIDEAKKQKELDDERIKKLDKVLNDFSKSSAGLEKLKVDFEKKSKEIDAKIQLASEESESKDKIIAYLNNQLDNEKILHKKEASKLIAERRERFIDERVRMWKRATNVELIFWLLILGVGVLWLLGTAGWSIKNATLLYINLRGNLIFTSVMALIGFVFTAITFKKWYDKNYDHSNIENYKKGIKLPDELKDID
jgi:hypothetical protein